MNVSELWVGRSRGGGFCPACGTALFEGTGAQERKLVSVLFVDMVGSTARADGADPEDVRDRNQLYFDECRSRIERHGGVVEKYIGDAVMAVFGAPLARAEDAERAVRAGLSILEGIEGLNERHASLDLAIRAAVCTGEAVVAMDAAPGRSAGDRGRREHGGASSERRRRPARSWSTRPRTGSRSTPSGSRSSRPSRRRARPSPSRRGRSSPRRAEPGSRPISDAPFVGRERELELLGSVWQRAVEAARPHLVTVLGPAGIGKTRLARELAEWVGSRGGRAVWGRSLPYEEPTPYRAAADMLREIADVYENDPVDAARAKVAGLVEELFPAVEAGDATRYLSVVLGLGVDQRPDEAIHLRFTVRMLLEHLAERQPLLLVFEDVHWADETLLELIDYLVTHVSDARVVVMALARPEFLETRRTWGGGMVGQTTLPLEPLGTEASAAVAAALLPGVQPEAIERVVSVAEGNPLFLEELMASVAGDISGAELPSTVRAAIAARIDTLPAGARAALLQASVIGQTFWQDVLLGAGELDGVDEDLEALEVRGLISRRRESSVEGDVEFAFKHVLIRDVAYATLPKASRRELHGSVARYLEAALADPAGFAWLLAHHWREAGEHRRRTRLSARGRRAIQGRARGGGDVRPLHPSARPRHDRRGPPPDPAAPCARARGAPGQRARRQGARGAVARAGRG